MFPVELRSIHQLLVHVSSGYLRFIGYFFSFFAKDVNLQNKQIVNTKNVTKRIGSYGRLWMWKVRTENVINIHCFIFKHNILFALMFFTIYYNNIMYNDYSSILDGGVIIMCIF